MKARNLRAAELRNYGDIILLCSSGIFKGWQLSGLNTEAKKLTLISWSRYFRGGGEGLLPEFYGIYIHHCDLYTNREEQRLADHRQSPHR